MKKRILLKRSISMIMAALLYTSQTVAPIYAESLTETSQIAEENLYVIDGINDEDGTEIEPQQEFLEALAKNPGGTRTLQICTYVNLSSTELGTENKDYAPIKIPGGTSIIGAGGSISTRSPLQLTGDHVLIQDIVFKVTNTSQKEIFLAGYSLTLDGVVTNQNGNIYPIIYGGAYVNTTEVSGINERTAVLTLKNASNTYFQKIVMAGRGDTLHSTWAEYTGNTIVNLPRTAVIHEGIHVEDSAEAAITISENAAGSSQVVSATNTIFYGNENSSLNLNHVSLQNAVVTNFGYINLENGARFFPASDSTSEFTSICVPEGTILNFSELSDVSVKNQLKGYLGSDSSSSGGTIMLNKAGSLNIEGEVLGRFGVQIWGGQENIIGNVTNEKIYITAALADEMGEDSFAFTSYHTNETLIHDAETYSLDNGNTGFINHTWRAEKTYVNQDTQIAFKSENGKNYVAYAYDFMDIENVVWKEYQENVTLTGALPPIFVMSGTHQIILNHVTIDTTGSYYVPFSVLEDYDTGETVSVDLILQGSNVFTGGASEAIWLEPNTALNIGGEGTLKLNVPEEEGCNGFYGDCGSLFTVSGGTVNIESANYALLCDNLSVVGGHLTAISKEGISVGIEENGSFTVTGGVIESLDKSGGLNNITTANEAKISGGNIRSKYINWNVEDERKVPIDAVTNKKLGLAILALLDANGETISIDEKITGYLAVIDEVSYERELETSVLEDEKLYFYLPLGELSELTVTSEKAEYVFEGNETVGSDVLELNLIKTQIKEPDITPDEEPDVTPDEEPDITPDEEPDVTPDEKTDTTTDEKTEEEVVNPSTESQKQDTTESNISEIGKIYTIAGAHYEITDSSTVSFVGLSNGSITKVVIKNTVEIDNKVYKVTAIKEKAFYKMKKVTQIVIGKNIKTIGSRAFEGCGKLKKITVKGTKIKTVGKNVLKGIKSSAVIKVPKKKLKAYKKIFKNKGQSKKVKFL